MSTCRKGKRKDKQSSKGIVFVKADESPTKNSLKYNFDNESINDNQESLPPLPKLLGVEPTGTSRDATSVTDFTKASTVLDKTKHVTEKVSLNKKIENLNDVKVKEPRSDNGTKFRNYKPEKISDKKGISKIFSSPCTPEQYGVAERRDRTLIEAAKTMLNGSRLPKQLLAGEVIRHTSTEADDINLNENKSFLDEFSIPRNPIHQYQRYDDSIPCVPTFDPLSINNITIIPDPITPTTKIIILTSKSPNSPVTNNHQITSQTDETELVKPYYDNEVPDQDTPDTKIIIDNEVISDSIPPTPPSKNNIVTPASQEKWPKEKHAILVKILGEPNAGIKPNKVVDALKEEGWVLAMQEELNQFKRNKIWTLVLAPYGKTIIGTKWIYRIKMDENRVVRREQGKAAYGFESNEFPKHVCKLDKALYGLKQAPRHGYQILDGKLACWSAKKQNSMVVSSTEVEYVANAGCCAQVLWMKNQLADYGI
ncbi:retrovirus-related pol polyprotein from transposon TNT 1-94 [Tanacetum coccineum]